MFRTFCTFEQSSCVFFKFTYDPTRKTFVCARHELDTVVISLVAFRQSENEIVSRTTACKLRFFSTLYTLQTTRPDSFRSCDVMFSPMMSTLHNDGIQFSTYCNYANFGDFGSIGNFGSFGGLHSSFITAPPPTIISSISSRRAIVSKTSKTSKSSKATRRATTSSTPCVSAKVNTSDDAPLLPPPPLLDSFTAALQRPNLIDDRLTDTGALTPSAPTLVAAHVAAHVAAPPTGIPVGIPVDCDDGGGGGAFAISASTCFGFPKALFKDGTMRPWKWGGALEDRDAEPPEVLLVDNSRGCGEFSNGITCDMTYRTKMRIGLLRNGSLKAWGSCSVDLPEECVVRGHCDVVVQISLGGEHAIALLKDGSVRVFGGRNLENNDNFSVPEDLRTAGRQRVVQVAAGASHSVALLEDGTLRAWGHNGDGQCDVPVELCFALHGQRVVQVAAGLRHTVALLTDGTLRAWGCNKDGQCNVSRKPLETRRVVQIATEFSHNVALFADGTTERLGGVPPPLLPPPTAFSAFADGTTLGAAPPPSASYASYSWPGQMPGLPTLHPSANFGCVRCGSTQMLQQRSSGRVKCSRCVGKSTTLSGALSGALSLIVPFG